MGAGDLACVASLGQQDLGHPAGLPAGKLISERSLQRRGAWSFLAGCESPTVVARVERSALAIAAETPKGFGEHLRRTRGLPGSWRE